MVLQQQQLVVWVLVAVNVWVGVLAVSRAGCAAHGWSCLAWAGHKLGQIVWRSSPACRTCITSHQPTTARFTTPLLAAPAAIGRTLAAEKAPLVQQSYERMRFDRACEAALSISSRGNQYLEETAPWTAFKKVGAGGVEWVAPCGRGRCWCVECMCGASVHE